MEKNTINMCLFNYLGSSYATNGVRDNNRPLFSSSPRKDCAWISNYFGACVLELDTKCFVGGTFLSFKTKVFNFSIKSILKWSRPWFCSWNTNKGEWFEFIGQKVGQILSWRRISQNIEGHIFEEKIHCTASKVDETWLKYSLSIYDCVIVQHLSDICETRR